MREERVVIGAVCAKTNGHLVFKGEHDFGACASHHIAEIVIIQTQETDRDIDWEALETREGELRNAYEELQWRMEGLEK